MWQDIFSDLVSNGEVKETLQLMWRQFMLGRLENKHIQEVFEKHDKLFTEGVATIFAAIDSKTAS